MPRRTLVVRTHSLPVRVLSTTLACLLSLPAPGLRASNAGQWAVAEETPAPVTAPVASATAPVAESSNPLPCRVDFEQPSSGARRNPSADLWGDITVAQPKIWQFERVSALLDGLLRDVEGVSLADVTQLDPSQQNGAALRFVQSALEVGVQYDQAAAVNASNVLSSYNALHASQLQQLDQYNNYMQTLTGERDRLASQYSAASNEVNALQALVAEGTATDEQQKQLADALSRQSSTQASLNSVNSLISGAGAAPTLTAPPTVTGTSVQGPASGSNMSSSLSGFSDVLKSLPQGVQNNLSSSLQSPSYPATKRLDNFITLLYERLAREISVLQDDLMRDPENEAFLLQFDVGLYASKKAKDHVARVEFKLGKECKGCKVYALYPGQSSYNLANYSGASKRNSFWGNVLTLIGLGLSASYRRQTDTLQGSLVQSVYTAGFQNGVANDLNADPDQTPQSFGWYYGAAPFEQVVTPGIRSTFAMITVPRTLIDSGKDIFGKADSCLPFYVDAGWANRNDPLAQDSYFSAAGSAAKVVREPFYSPRRNPLIHPPLPGQQGHCTPSGPSGSIQQGDCPPTYDESVLTMHTRVKVPAFQDDYPLIAKRERKLHVVRMEYNTVKEPPDTAAKTTVVQTSVQTSLQTTNPGTGQTSGQTATQTTGTTVTAGTTPVSTGSAASPSPALDPLPCPKAKCAAILIGLDRPIDPNLAITVRGKPMMRVRDWRGRATSVLPPAQSGSDLAATTNTAGSLNTKQLEAQRSLMEIDQFAPNAWFALNSHELILNVSVDVAADEEFPVIQLVDPSGAIVVPHDLRRGFTELVINGFRLKPQTNDAIQEEIRRQSWSEDLAKRVNAVRPQGRTDNEPITFGPYPFSTFLPLFSPVPAARNFFAAMGETGNDLLIGFTSRRGPERDTGRTVLYNWLETKTQVILEDRDWDFAWSLSCDAQGALLACHVPREEISRVYRNFLKACPDDVTCPGLGPDREPLIRSLSRKLQQVNGNRSETQVDPPSTPQSQSLGRREKSVLHNVSAIFQQETGDKTGESASKPKHPVTGEPPVDLDQDKAQPLQKWAKVFNDNQDLKDFARAFVSTMQVSIQQSDEEGKNVFYSPAPVRIGFLPLSDDYWKNVPFKPWDFLTADYTSLTIRECNYLPRLPRSYTEDNPDTIFASILGMRADSWGKWLSECSQNHHPQTSDDAMHTPTFSNSQENACRQMNQVAGRDSWAELPADAERCSLLTMPTSALANDPVVFEMEFPPHPHVPTDSVSKAKDARDAANEKEDVLRTTIAIPRSRLGPSFRLSQLGIRQTFEPPPSPAKNELQKEIQTGTAQSALKDPNVWQLVIPVVNSACGDDIDIPGDLRRAKKPEKKAAPGDAQNEETKYVPDYSKIDVQWRNGNSEMTCPEPPGPEPSKPKSAKPGTAEYKKWDTDHKRWEDKNNSWQAANEIWQAADQADRVRLYLEIPRVAIGSVPDLVDVVRKTADDVTWAVSSLPNLKRLLLPYRLTLDPMGATQFALQGENAGAIDAVVLQGSSGNPTTRFPVAKGLDFAMVILPSASTDTSGNSDNSTNDSAGTTSSTQITVDATKDNTGHVQMTTKNSSTPAKPAGKPGTTSAKPSSDDSSSAVKSLAAGSYAVIPFIEIGTSPADPAKLSAKTKADNAVSAATVKLNQAEADLKKSPKDASKQKAVDDAKTKLQAAQKTAQTAASAAKPTSLYMPLPVTDTKGKPLIFTIPDTKKQPSTTKTTTPTAPTCAAPCLVAPCSTTCPTAQTTAPKSP